MEAPTSEQPERKEPKEHKEKDKTEHKIIEITKYRKRDGVEQYRVTYEGEVYGRKKGHWLNANDIPDPSMINKYRSSIVRKPRKERKAATENPEEPKPPKIKKEKKEKPVVETVVKTEEMLPLKPQKSSKRKLESILRMVIRNDIKCLHVKYEDSPLIELEPLDYIKKAYRHDLLNFYEKHIVLVDQKVPLIVHEQTEPNGATSTTTSTSTDNVTNNSQHEPTQ